MTYQNHKNLTPIAAVIAAGEHLRTKDAGDPFDMLSKKFSDLTDETLKRIGKADGDITEVKSALLDLQQRTARAGDFGGGITAQPTWGQEFTEAKSADIGELAQSNQGRISMNVKAALTSSSAFGGAIFEPTRDQTVLMPQQRLVVRDLLTVISITTGAVEYASQTTRPMGADVVAEGAQKPESAIDWELKTTSSKVIAHWIKASRQILDDVPQLSDLIDSEMRYGLAIKEESQLLGGDGTGSNLMGMIPSAVAFVDPLGMSLPNEIDTVGAAILQTALADFPANGIIMHPADWWRMRLLKDADGKYILGDPQAVVQPSLFGLPVVTTKAMAVDKFLVGDFKSAGTLYDRWQARVETGYVNDDFTRNLITVLAEDRIAFAVKQSNALTYGDFGNVA
jgi:HK97 family phage major capsid protein